MKKDATILHIFRAQNLLFSHFVKCGFCKKNDYARICDSMSCFSPIPPLKWHCAGRQIRVCMPFFALFFSGLGPGKWEKGKIHEKKHKKSHSFAIKPKSGRYPPQRKPAAAVLAVAYSLEISMRPTSLMVRPLLRQASSTRAVSMAVRQGMESSTALRRSFTLSRLGRRPLEEVDST